MPINRALSLTWDGQEYDIAVTMKLIDKIEDKINLFQLAAQLESGDIRFSKVAQLFAVLLQSAGAKVTADDVYQGMFSGGDVNPADLIVVLGEVFAAIFPEPPEKSEATPPKKKAAKS